MEFGQFAWIAFFAAAAILQLSKRGNGVIVLAFIAFGLPGFSFALVRWGALNVGVLEDMREVLMFLPFVAAALLVVGVAVLARGGARGASVKAAMQDIQPAALATIFIPRNDTNTYSRAELLRDEALS